MVRRSLIVLFIVIAALALAAIPAFAQGGGDPVKGKAAWDANLCKSCHGPNGEGKYAAPLAGTARTVDELLKQVRTPRANMPAFDDKHVADQDLRDIWSYMETLTKPASFSPITYTAQTDDLPGKVLFNQKRCVACHGSDPSAFLKSRFVDKGREITADVVTKQLRTPAQRMPMFSATQVSDDQARQIADYYKSVAAKITPSAPTTQTAATAPTATPAPAPVVAPAPATLPTSGGEASTLPLVLATLGVLVLGIGGGALAYARTRD
jgi:mono/diheme cytochrome c family protein